MARVACSGGTVRSRSPTTRSSGTASAGKAYVVFGQSTGTAINITELNAGTSNKGYVINGVGGVTDEKFGGPVAGAGDVNGDGFTDSLDGGSGNDLSENKPENDVLVSIEGRF